MVGVFIECIRETLFIESYIKLHSSFDVKKCYCLLSVLIVSGCCLSYYDEKVTYLSSYMYHYLDWLLVLFLILIKTDFEFLVLHAEI